MRRTGSSTTTRLILTVEEFLGIVAFILGHFMNIVIVLDFIGIVDFVIFLNVIGYVAFISESYVNIIDYEYDMTIEAGHNYIVLFHSFEVYTVQRRRTSHARHGKYPSLGVPKNEDVNNGIWSPSNM